VLTQREHELVRRALSYYIQHCIVPTEKKYLREYQLAYKHLGEIGNKNMALPELLPSQQEEILSNVASF
jgi:hypothetical protein